MYSARDCMDFIHAGFPIRRFTDRRLLTAPRDFSQFCHVLHRLLVPRHPPNALNSLTTRTVASRAELAALRQMAKSYSCLHSVSLFAFVSLGRMINIWTSCEEARSELPMHTEYALTPLCFTLRSTLQFSDRVQWAKQDLNLRPRAYQARALTN